MQFMNPTLRALATLLIAALVSVPASATVTSAISVDPVQHFTDGNGALLSGGKLFTYAAGTTTKQATYTDSTAGTTNTNPVILNSRGEANVWFDQSKAYKLVLAPSTDTDPPANPIWTVDNLSALSATNILSQITTFTSQIQSQSVNYAADSGSANAYVVTLSPVPSSLSTGFPVRFKAGNTNTGASTLNVNALGAVAIHRQDGSALQAGDITAGQMVYTSFDGTYFQLLWAGVSQVQLQSQTGNYAVDTGSTNSIVVTPSPVVAAYAAGLTLRVKISNTNTGSTTINVSGLGPKNVTTQNISSLWSGALQAAGIYELIYDGTEFQAVGGTNMAGGYQVITGSTTFTVPAGVTNIRVLTIGGGASGGNSGSGYAGAGAGMGNFSVGSYNVIPLTPYTVTIGAGATANTTGGTSGTSGGTTSFGGLQSSTGGTGGGYGISASGGTGGASGGAAGASSALGSAGSAPSTSGLSTLVRASISAGTPGAAGTAVTGAGGGAAGLTISGAPTASAGNGAGASTSWGYGGTGFGAGGGGSGNTSGYVGGAGAQGAVYVEW